MINTLHFVTSITELNSKKYRRICVSCLVLSANNEIILQKRDHNAPTFPNRLAAFGGGVEQDETPIQALIRELKEELGALVQEKDVIPLAVFTEAETNYQELIYAFFWHDKFNSITGCYEGKAKYYKHFRSLKNDPNLMGDALWLLEVCSAKGYI